MEINYIGEHLVPGYLGNFFISLSFTTALLASVAYFFSAKHSQEQPGWLNIARISFKIHAFAVVATIVTLFYIIINNYFEYYYAWHHANKALPLKYMFACFWEGQEGSFLLWSFWHALLGLLLMRNKSDISNLAMGVLSSTQVFLTSMVLGIIIFNYKFGSNPFTLLRDHPDMQQLPFTKVPNYLENLDGRGLNPLLQNYWMTIHPPVLFLGFASTTIPFALAIAGLIKKEFVAWIKQALPWTVFAVMILGNGILMGGAWAYESLSFGGFWAWDPVENASLVPWLILTGALHLMLLHKARGGYLKTTLVFTMLTFILVLYSTFLTRSGVLGETSVHAFTDLGMNGQLLAYLLFYLVGSLILLFYQTRNIPNNKGEEDLWSREFWMFIGSLVLAISAFQIIFTTSIPVINKILSLSKKIAPPTDLMAHYNGWQLPFAIIISIIIAVSQFFKYKKTEPSKFLKEIAPAFIISLTTAIIVAFVWPFSKFYYSLFFFASVFAIVANLDYWLRIMKGKFSFSGSSVAHVGFGLILLGVLISTGKKQVISQNTSGISVEQLGKDFSNAENIMLTLGDTLKMGNYYLTYQGKRQEGIHLLYKIDYLTKNNNVFKHEFTLEPIIQLNDRMGNVAEPATKHFLHKDVYTHITYADLETKPEKAGEWKDNDYKGVKIGDTIYTSSAIIKLIGLNKDSLNKKELKLKDSDLAVGLVLEVHGMNGAQKILEPIFVVRDNYVYPLKAQNDELNIKAFFTRIDPLTGKIDLKISEKPEAKKDFIVLKALIFPGINILWTGCLVMIIGSIMAIIARIKNVNQ